MAASRYAIAMLMTLALVPAAWSQSAVPSPLNGNRETPRLSGDTELNNLLSVDLGISSHFDDNALNDNQHKVSNFIYQFAPRVSWDVSRAHWSFSADSLTTISYSYNLPQYGRFGENLIVGFDFRPVRRLDFRLRNSFNRSSDPFTRYPGSNVPDFENPPNQSILGPPATRTSDQVGMDVTYQLGPHTNLGASGSFALVNYESSTVTPSFVQPDTYSVSGRAFVTHQFSPRHTSSLAYDIQRFTFSTSLGTTTHSIAYYHTVTLTPSMSLSVWGGPEYVRTSAGFLPQPIQGSWSWTAGAQYGWTHNRTGVTASVVRQVSDGGGLGYAVQLVSANVGLRQRLSRRWVASAYVNYNVNHSVSGFGNFGTRYFSGNASVTRTFTPHLGLTVEYWRARQGRSTGLGLLVPSDHNRAAVTLHYTFSRSIGS
ncbi:MAG TPA: hypothetical protein VMS96_05440 [Terriglobales bacterium]|nr:hypothetical protein [Terriglobales bacterium]